MFIRIGERQIILINIPAAAPPLVPSRLCSCIYNFKPNVSVLTRSGECTLKINSVRMH